MKRILFLFLLLPILSFGQGTMDFESVELPTAYSDGDFTDNGIDYHYNHSRDQADFAIDGNGLLLRRASDSYLEWTVENGVGSLSFDYRKAYTGGSVRQLEVLVNGEQVALTDEFGEGSGEQDDIYTLTVDIDMEGSVTIRIKNEGDLESNKQSVIDNISWTATENSGPGDGDDCSQEVETPDEFYNAFGNLHLLEVANDLVIPAGKNYELQSIKAVILTETGATYDGIKLRYYADAGNKPGSLIGESDVLEPTDKNVIEVLQGVYDRTEVTIELDEPFTFVGSGGETPAWVGITLDNYSGDGSYLEVSPDLHGTNEIYLFDGEWYTGTELFSDLADGIISFYGECSDLVACDGQPEAGEISGDSTFGICPGTAFSLSLTGTTAASGLSMQWQESLDGGDTWSDIAGATEASLNLEDGITEPTSYRVEVTCDDSGLSDITDPVSVTINTPEECACIPEFSFGCGLGDVIDGFTLNGENDTAIEDLATGCSPEGYEDHTDMSADLGQNGVYTASITGPEDADDAIIIWIDFNDDGEFDQSERVALQVGVTPGASNEVDLEIPADAALGSHKMRVMVAWAATVTDPDEITACNDGSLSFGETHDYSVNIIEEMGVDANEFAGFHYYPNPMDQEMVLKANSPIENLEVYNLIGQRVISLNPNAMETTFDGSKLESGVYLMRVTINGAQKSFKIVKK